MVISFGNRSAARGVQDTDNEIKQRTSSQFGSRFGTPAGDARMRPVLIVNAVLFVRASEEERTNTPHLKCEWKNRRGDGGDGCLHTLMDILKTLFDLTTRCISLVLR